MRPLHLRLSGLHSYREEVEVDFTTLGQFGLFGIFGAIGSGKSTLLDGITLALYGVIDRVHGRSRRGIVNHHVSRVEVRFRFAVGDVYEVQRSYKRDPSGIAKRLASRICQVDDSGSLAVIADKEREVNDTIQNLIGLTADDFMRAVVLPQGRFMEFLHLKGSDRRAMLQRIFRLSAYGEGLRSQLQAERTRCNVAVETHRGELRGLGDASPAAVATARRNRAAAEAELAKRQASFAELEHRFSAALTGRERRSALLKAETNLAQHRRGLSEIGALTERIRRANTARVIAKPAEAWASARDEAGTAAAATVVAASKHATATAHRVSTESAAQAARSAMKQDWPALQERVKRLDRAALLAAQLASVESDAARAAVEVTERNNRSDDLERQNSQLVQALATLTTRRKDLSAEFASCQVGSDARERLLAASRAHDNLVRLQAEVAALRARIASHETLSGLQVSPGEDLVSACERAIRASASGFLAAQLARGSTCLVCGSTEHPDPAAPKPGDTPRELVDQLAAAHRAERLGGDLNRAHEAELAAWDSFDRDRGELTLFDIPNHLRALADKDRRAAELYPALETVQCEISTAQQGRDSVAANLASARQALAKATERARSLADQRTDLLGQLRGLGDDTDVAVIEQTRAGAAEAINQLQRLEEQTAANATEAAATATATATRASAAEARALATTEAERAARATLRSVLSSAEVSPDADIAEITRHALSETEIAHLQQIQTAWHETLAVREAAVNSARSALPAEVLADSEWVELTAAHRAEREALDGARAEATAATLIEADLATKAVRHAELIDLCVGLDLRLGRLDTLSRVLRGNRFVEFIANDYLAELADEANRHLAKLTSDRYTLVLDDDGSFLVRDEDGGGALRPVTSLSGGETFVASLALALALSTQVQARSAQPLELFFLDEGFGTLDGEALDRVMTAIESLQSDARTIGVISHVPAVRERVPRYVMVSSGGRDGSGSKLRLHDN